MKKNSFYFDSHHLSWLDTLTILIYDDSSDYSFPSLKASAIGPAKFLLRPIVQKHMWHEINNLIRSPVKNLYIDCINEKLKSLVDRIL